jgi:hypothetical protein
MRPSQELLLQVLQLLCVLCCAELLCIHEHSSCCECATQLVLRPCWEQQWH